MNREYVVIPQVIFEATKGLESDDFKKCITALLEYSFYGIELPVTGMTRTFMELAKPVIDRNIKLYETRAGRHCCEYNDWRKKVYERDKYTCQICGIKGGKLNAHHIHKYSQYPALRYDIDNGITLCEDCHRKIHKGNWKYEQSIRPLHRV